MICIMSILFRHDCCMWVHDIYSKGSRVCFDLGGHVCRAWCLLWLCVPGSLVEVLSLEAREPSLVVIHVCVGVSDHVSRPWWSWFLVL